MVLEWVGLEPGDWVMILGPLGVGLIGLGAAALDIYRAEGMRRRRKLRDLAAFTIIAIILFAIPFRGLLRYLWGIHPLGVVGPILFVIFFSYAFYQGVAREPRGIPKPRLRDLKAVEEALREAPQPISIDKLYEAVSDQMDYGVYRRVLDYLEESGRIKLSEDRRILKVS